MKKRSAVSSKPSAKKSAAKKAAAAPAKKAGAARKALARKTAAPATVPAPAPDPDAATASPARDALLTFVSIMPSPLNPRRAPAPGDADRALEDSIVADGLLQPLLVRPAPATVQAYIAGGDVFEIICGERRYRAIKRAVDAGRLPEDWPIPVRIRAASDEELIVLAGTENLARADMDPLDEAALYDALRKIIRARDDHRGRPEAEVAHRFHVTERTVFRRLQLLRLAPALHEALRAGTLTLAQAAALAFGPPDEQTAHVEKYRDSEWQMLPEVIRAAMVGKAVDVEIAIFPLDRYDGDIVEDAEGGKRYFADVAQFKRLQRQALAEKQAELEGDWPWVRKIQAGDEYGYPKAPKGDKKGKHARDPDAGAIVWLDYGDRFHSRLGVLTPETVKTRRAAQAGGTAATPKGGATRHRSYQAVDRMRRAIADEIATAPCVALAVAILGSFLEWGTAERIRRRAGAFAAPSVEALADAAGCAIAELPYRLASLDEEGQQDTEAAVLGELLQWELPDLAAFFAALEAEEIAETVAYHGLDEMRPVETVIATRFGLDLAAIAADASRDPAPDADDDGDDDGGDEIDVDDLATEPAEEAAQ